MGRRDRDGGAAHPLSGDEEERTQSRDGAEE